MPRSHKTSNAVDDRVRGCREIKGRGPLYSSVSLENVSAHTDKRDDAFPLVG
jgi:hypothetical protein